MSSTSKPRPAFKVWLETDEGYVFGPGVYSLLRKVKETGTLKEAAGALGMSYRYAWGLVKKAEEKLRQPLLKAHKGGRWGGGGTELTEIGQQFLDEFSMIETIINQLSREGWRFDEHRTGNRVEGRVEKVEVGEDRAEIALKLSRSIFKVDVPKKLIVEREIAEGDHLSVELSAAVKSIKKLRGSTPSE